MMVRPDPSGHRAAFMVLDGPVCRKCRSMALRSCLTRGGDIESRRRTASTRSPQGSEGTQMNATPTFGRLGDHAVDRRRFLGLIATGAAVVGIPGLLTACSTTPTPSATNPAAAAGDVIPKYIPVTYIDPDY